MAIAKKKIEVYYFYACKKSTSNLQLNKPKTYCDLISNQCGDGRIGKRARGDIQDQMDGAWAGHK